MELLKPPSDKLLISRYNGLSTMTDTTKMTDAAVQKKVRNVAVVTGVIALVVGLGAGVMITKNLDTEAAPVSGQVGTSENNTDTGNALALGSALSAPSVAAITVSDQKAGMVALVSLVSTDAPAWLALRENNNGLVGNILGAKRLDVGTAGNVEIPLLRATQVGKSYSVVLFKDNGDKVFDFKTDAPMTADGTLISKSFMVN